MLFEKNKRVPNKRNQKDNRYRYNHQKIKAFSQEKFKKSRHIQKKARKSKKSTRK